MNSPRPIIKITPKPIDQKLELSAKLLLLLMWLFTLFLLFTLPQTIPIHFNVKGETDGYGHKLTMLLLPILGTCIYFGITKLNNYPHIFNYLTIITTQNAERQYKLATTMMRFLKLAVLVIFIIVLVFVYLTIKGIVYGLGWWFLPLVLLLLITPTIIFIIKSIKQ